MEKLRALFDGIGVMFDFFGILSYPSQSSYGRKDLTPERKDYLAIASDWQYVWNDFGKAFKEAKMDLESEIN